MDGEMNVRGVQLSVSIDGEMNVTGVHCSKHAVSRHSPHLDVPT